MRKYSQTTGNCYIVGFHTEIPSDAVDIPDDRYDQVIANPAPGKIRNHDASGLPVLIDPPALSDAEIKVATIATVADRRYQQEISGFNWNGLYVATDRQSQAKLNESRQAVNDGLRVDGTVWKCFDLTTSLPVFRPTTNAEILDLSAAAFSYVQACFAREGVLTAAVLEGSYVDSMLDEGWPV